MRARLRALLGEKALVPPENQVRYETGYRYGLGTAAAVVRPADTAGVRAVLRFCKDEQVRLVLQGAHTGLLGAATPDQTGEVVVVSLERMNAVQVDPFNRSASCGAGVRLSALNAAAAAHDLCLPIDLGADPSIGGMAATNTGGARLLRYGGMREQVLGLEAVLLDEHLTVVGGARALRKDNSGIDLKQLLIGSGGKLGVITQVQVKLQPVLKQSITALAVPAGMMRIAEIIARLESRLDHFLIACEFMSKAAMAVALDTHPALRRPFDDLPECALLIEAGSSAAAGEDLQIEPIVHGALAACMEGAQPLLQDAIIGRGQEFWAIRHAIPDGLKTLGRVIGFDVAVRRDQLMPMRAAVLAAVAREFPDLPVFDFGHVGDGGMHFNAVVPKSMTFDAAAEQRLRSLLLGIVVRDFDGSFSAEHGIGPANMAQYNEYRSADERRIIAAIAAVMDPGKLLQ